MNPNELKDAIFQAVTAAVKALMPDPPAPAPFESMRDGLRRFKASNPQFSEKLDAPGGDDEAFIRFIAAAHIYAAEKGRLAYTRLKSEREGVTMDYASSDKAGEPLGFLKLAASSTIVDDDGDTQSPEVLEAGRLIARYRVAKGQTLFDDNHDRAGRADRLLIDDWVEEVKTAKGVEHQKVFVIYLENPEDRRKAAAGEFTGASDELTFFFKEVAQDD